LYTLSPLRLNDRSAVFYLFLCVDLLWSFVLLFMRTEYVDWVLFSQRLKGIWRCLFPVVHTDWIEPDTPQPSVCCFSFPLSDAFKHQNPPLFEVSMAAATTRLLCCAHLLPYASADPEICSSSLPPGHFCSSRTLRSFKLLMPPFKFSSSRPPVVVLPTIFFRAFFLFIWALLYLLSMHMFIPYTFFWTFSFSHTLLSHLIPQLHLLGSVSFLVSRHLWITFRVLS